MDGELQRTKTRAHLAAPFMWLEDVRSRFPGSGLHRWEIIGDYWRQGSCLSLVGMATGCPAATKFGLLGLWPNPMHYKGLGKDTFQILNLCFNWFLFIIQLISLPQISHAIWLYPSPEYFFISRNTHISFHSDLGITGASSVGWCISLAGHAFTRCRLGQDLCDVGIRKSEVNTETRNPRCDILWKGCFNMF